MSTDPAGHRLAPHGAASSTRRTVAHSDRTDFRPGEHNEHNEPVGEPAPGEGVDVLDLATDIATMNISTPTFLTVDRTGKLERMDLHSEDPVEQLFGIVVQRSVNAVGICAPAMVTTAEQKLETGTDHVVIHVVNRHGTSVTTLTTGSDSRRFGPNTDPQTGRVPDTCRRVLGLPTCPPTDSMTDFVLAAWLEVIARHALDRPGLEWSDITGLHPATHCVPAPITPTALAKATLDLGTSLDWDRFRRVIAKVGGFPFGDNAIEIAAWMDDGMFSRWAMDSIPTCNEALDLLEAVLGPATFDRLWATVRLCR